VTEQAPEREKEKNEWYVNAVCTGNLDFPLPVMVPLLEMAVPVPVLAICQ
jgi:hypothetical protein